MPPVTVPIRRVRQCPHLCGELQWTFYHELQIEMETEVGLPYGQGSDPQVLLRWSDDGGKTWSNEHWCSAGLIGDYRRRVIWRRLGRSRDRVFQVSMTDPVKWALVDSYLDAEPGTS